MFRATVAVTAMFGWASATTPLIPTTPPATPIDSESTWTVASAWTSRPPACEVPASWPIEAFVVPCTFGSASATPTATRPTAPPIVSDATVRFV